MKHMTFINLAERILKEENKPLSVEEIWSVAEDKGYDVSVGTKGKTPWRTIGAQIYISIRDDVNSPFVKIDSKPRKFFLKALASEKDIQRIKDQEEQKVEQPAKMKYQEKDLHQLLSYYAYNYMRIYTKTIEHTKSSKKTYAQWLHPDLVGVYFPIGEWETEILDFGVTTQSGIIKLYSFELKRQLTYGNIRESFFQAVSNSSWANEGYLVAAMISKDDDFKTELERLSSSFGIGIIQLDTTDPDSTEIIFPAKPTLNWDWDTMNKLAKENPNFKKFIKRIHNDFNSKEIRKEEYDKVTDADALKKFYESKM